MDVKYDINKAKSMKPIHLSKLQVTVDEGPLQQLLDGGNAHFVLLVHENLVKITVLDFLTG